MIEVKELKFSDHQRSLRHLGKLKWGVGLDILEGLLNLSISIHVQFGESGICLHITYKAGAT